MGNDRDRGWRVNKELHGDRGIHVVINREVGVAI